LPAVKKKKERNQIPVNFLVNSEAKCIFKTRMEDWKKQLFFARNHEITEW